MPHTLRRVIGSTLRPKPHILSRMLISMSRSFFLDDLAGRQQRSGRKRFASVGTEPTKPDQLRDARASFLSVFTRSANQAISASSSLGHRCFPHDAAIRATADKLE
ncbi:hypothetical protein [Rhizobium sp. 57MFTsu3.2]|uniref:hypothetical protein n=1 Tax=Rhizobium sp. 57MFTsu3.2 TaxID=1048681 RepID=UPI001AEEE293|nr:hypothetical protein [Rhizobium sp. 57MFTsu3.2]